MYFDGHVHCRDEEESGKDTIEHVLRVCERAGVDGINDMSNTKRPITTRQRVYERLRLADACHSPVYYGLSVGLTSNPDQICEAVSIYNEFHRDGILPRVLGLKLFAGSSTGDLAVTRFEDQERVYKTLSDCNYRGVLIVHAEDENWINENLFDYRNPATHCLVRPKGAELSSVKHQVRHIINNNFDGTVHIAHVSTIDTMKYIVSCCREIGEHPDYKIKLSCGVTPHHLFLDDSVMSHGDGILYKVNPPLRTREDNKGLLEHLRKGTITCIETDHAPHTLEEKRSSSPPSGIPGIDKWPKIAKKLKEMVFAKEQIEDLTFFNAVKLFGLEKVVKRTDNAGDLNLREYSYGNYL